MSRFKNPSFSRDNSNADSYWEKEFVANLEKTSVHSREKDISLFHQISQIISGKHSKYSTVDEAVADYRKLTGLDQVLNKLANTITEPELFKTIPEMKIFIDNYVKNNLNVIPEAIIEVIMKDESIRKKLPNRNEIPNDVRIYIATKLKEAKEMSPSIDEHNLNIGKQDLMDTEVDQQHNDPFYHLIPNQK